VYRPKGIAFLMCSVSAYKGTCPNQCSFLFSKYCISAVAAYSAN
jgi:hypothetical protein